MDDLVGKLKRIIFLDEKKVGVRGRILGHYFDFNRVCAYPDVLIEVVDRFKDKVNQRTNLLVGCGSGASALVTAMGTRYNIGFCWTRDEKKGHGVESDFEGSFPNSESLVTIVDDVLTTGGTMLRTKKIVERTNAEILGYSVVINRVKVSLKELEPFTWLFKEKEFLDYRN